MPGRQADADCYNQFQPRMLARRMNNLRFSVLHQDQETKARTGLLETAHGTVETPVFMPVGTLGSIKGLTQDQVEELGAQIILANTYHLFLRPGVDVLKEIGGLHRLMSWNRALLTDSGGYQIFSLKALSKVSDEGVEFKSHLDGSRHMLSPERAVEIQSVIGSDIMMVLDDCPSYPATQSVVQKAVERTLRWADRSRLTWDRLSKSEENPSTGALFGIVQGGIYADLRRECAERLATMDLPGYAMGGLSIGEERETTYEMVAVARDVLPPEKPRYVMGVGLPEEIPYYVAQGVDMMDCVLPTRNGRNGLLFTSQGRMHIRQARFARDSRPVDESCACPTCRRYSRAYLRHLFVAGEMLGGILNSCHNIYFYLDTMRRIRQTIAAGEFSRFVSSFTPRVKGEVP